MKHEKTVENVNSLKDNEERLSEIRKHLTTISNVKPETVVAMYCMLVTTQDGSPITLEDIQNEKDIKVQVQRISLGRGGDIAKIIKITLEDNQHLLGNVILEKLKDRLGDVINPKGETTINLDDMAEKVVMGAGQSKHTKH